MTRATIRAGFPSRNSELTPDLVRDFWAYMQRRYSTKVVRKSSSTRMKAIGRLFAVLGVMKYDAFMRFATTLRRMIYIPFEIGVADDRWSLWDQIVVCVHEHEHVEEYLEDGAAYERRYLFNKHRRAIYEARASRSNFEIHFWRYGRLPNPVARARMLRKYGCSDLDIEVAEKYLAISIETIKHGGVINRSSRRAISGLNKLAPGLAHG